MIKRIWYLAALTFREGIRDRAVFGVMGIALLMFLATIAMTSMFGYDIGKVAVDLNLSVVGFTGLLLCFFVNINLLAKDIDKRTIYCVLSKPISRPEYILGKYAGTLSLILMSILFLAGFGAVMIALIKWSSSGVGFKVFSWACYFQAIAYEMGMFVILNAAIVFFSAFSSSSFLTLLFSLGTYVAGQNIEAVIQFLKSAKQFTSPGKRIFWLGLEFAFPNFSAFDIKVLASHGMLMSGTHSLLLFFYSVLYASLLLFLAIQIFSRRELQ
jgi:ABC-type transport system involved in multi-copper enzyme maturation permease subunit